MGLDCHPHVRLQRQAWGNHAYLHLTFNRQPWQPLRQALSGHARVKHLVADDDISEVPEQEHALLVPALPQRSQPQRASLGPAGGIPGAIAPVAGSGGSGANGAGAGGARAGVQPVRHVGPEALVPPPPWRQRMPALLEEAVNALGEAQQGPGGGVLHDPDEPYYPELPVVSASLV